MKVILRTNYWIKKSGLLICSLTTYFLGFWVKFRHRRISNVFRYWRFSVSKNFLSFFHRFNSFRWLFSSFGLFASTFNFGDPVIRGALIDYIFGVHLLIFWMLSIQATVLMERTLQQMKMNGSYHSYFCGWPFFSYFGFWLLDVSSKFQNLVYLLYVIHCIFSTLSICKQQPF